MFVSRSSTILPKRLRTSQTDAVDVFPIVAKGHLRLSETNRVLASSDTVKFLQIDLIDALDYGDFVKYSCLLLSLLSRWISTGNSRAGVSQGIVAFEIYGFSCSWSLKQLRFLETDGEYIHTKYEKEVYKGVGTASMARWEESVPFWGNRLPWQQCRRSWDSASTHLRWFGWQQAFQRGGWWEGGEMRGFPGGES